MGFTNRKKSGKLIGGSSMIVPGEGIFAEKVNFDKTFKNKIVSSNPLNPEPPKDSQNNT